MLNLFLDFDIGRCFMYNMRVKFLLTSTPSENIFFNGFIFQRFTCFYELGKLPNSRLIVGYSENRAKKEIYNRAKGVKRLQKAYKSETITKENINTDLSANEVYKQYRDLWVIEKESSLSLETKGSVARVPVVT